MSQIILTPTYPSDPIEVAEANADLVIDLAPVLRGEKGDTGVGILGVNVVADAATVSINLADPYGVYTVTLGGNRNLTFTGGTPALDRKRFILEVTQDATGSRTLTPDATVGFGADIPSIVLSTGAGVTDALGFIYRNSAGKSYLLAVNHGA